MIYIHLVFVYINKNMLKRTISVLDVSNATEIEREYKRRRYNDEYINITDIYNYMHDDSIVDWLQTKYENKERNLFKEHMNMKGNSFEFKVVEFINKNINHVVYVSNRITPESVRQTENMIKAGVPIIHSAPVVNEENKTKGIIDLLVRSDFINHIVEDIIFDDCDMTYSDSHVYYVIDIKFARLRLCSDGEHIMNCENFPYHKAQTYLYTKALSNIQGVDVPYAFILGNGYRYKTFGITYESNSCVEKLGKISFDDRDNFVKLKVEKALQWLRDVRQYGEQWTTDPPSRLELYPNMNKDSGIWNGYKKQIANELSEITSLYQLGLKHRMKAFSNGVKNWKDERLNSELLGITGKRGEHLDKILDINRDDSDIVILPKQIKNNMYDWKKTHKNDLFVDFETFGSVFSDFNSLPYYKSSSMIFMIGVGRVVKGKWRYKEFTCKSTTKEEELRIITEFNTYILKRKNPRLFYWSAEYNIWTQALDKHCKLEWSHKTLWCDLLKLFIEEQIVIKGAFSYGLKLIVNAMKKHNLIETELESECKNGLDAMVLAWNYYTEKNEKIMEDIIKYNEFDCKALYDILTYLRKHHK
jgi:predicted RecB family nuclease